MLAKEEVSVTLEIWFRTFCRVGGEHAEHHERVYADLVAEFSPKHSGRIPPRNINFPCTETEHKAYLADGIMTYSRGGQWYVTKMEQRIALSLAPIDHPVVILSKVEAMDTPFDSARIIHEKIPQDDLRDPPEGRRLAGSTLVPPSE